MGTKGSLLGPGSPQSTLWQKTQLSTTVALLPLDLLDQKVRIRHNHLKAEKKSEVVVIVTSFYIYITL